MKGRIRRMAAVFAAGFLFLLAGCGGDRRSTDRAQAEQDAQNPLAEMIIAEGHGERDLAKQYLEELRSADSQQGEVWSEILKYWEYVEGDMPVNLDRLPEDLPEGENLVLVVLGYQLKPDGTMYDELKERLAVALNCAEQYPNAYVLCTGGGTAMRNPDATEAGEMGKWLISHGLAEERLIIEDQSRTTTENAVNACEILRRDYPQIDSAAIISSKYHIPWGAVLFEAVFLLQRTESAGIHVVSNCACDLENPGFQDIIRYETAGLLQLCGDDRAAVRYFYSLSDGAGSRNSAPG